MTFRPLASSSAGNAYLVEDMGSRILIECGISFRRLQKALDYTVPDLDGCLITHEHKDHAGHVDKLIQCGVPVYASPGTVMALPQQQVIPFLLPAGRNLGPAFPLGGFTVVPFRTFHDATEPVGYLLRGRDGEELVFATDTVGLAYRFPAATIFALEANFQAERLERSTRIPAARAKRVRSTHMEIGRLCQYLETLDWSRCRELWLLHLSDSAGDEQLFVDLASRVTGPRVLVQAAPRG